MAEIKRSGSSLHYYSFRLRKKLEGILTAPVTVVEAPSGFGKSTAVRDYIMESLPEGTPVYWWNAAEGDPVNSWDRLCRELIHIDSSAGKELLAAGFPKLMSAWEIGQILRSISCSTQTVLVLDDFQYLQKELPYIFMSELLSCDVDRLHIVIITQTARPFQLSFFEQAKVHLIRAEDLRLNEEDVRQYCRMCGVAVSPNEVRQIYEYTEGWIVALYLIILQIQRGEGYSHSLGILQLMENIVWKNLGDEEKRLLLHIAPFPGVTIEQINFLLQEHELPERILALLEETPFISYETDERRYVPHAILLETLRRRLAAADAVTKRHCFRRAGDWYARTGDVGHAISCYLEVGEYEAFLSLPLTGMTLVRINGTPFTDVAARMLEECPPEIKRKHPVSLLRIAYALIGADQKDKAAKLLEEIRNIIKDISDETRQKALMGEWMLISAYLEFPDIIKMEPLIRKAAEMIGGRCKTLTAEEPFAFGMPMMILFHKTPGRLKEEIEALSSVSGLLSVLTGIKNRGEVFMKGEVALYRNDLSEAELLVYQAAYHADAAGQWPIRMGAANLLGHAAFRRGKHSDLPKYFKAIEESVGSDALSPYVMEMLRAGVYIWLELGKLLPQWLRDGKTVYPDAPSWAKLYAGYIHLAVLLQEQEYIRLLGTAEVLLKECREQGYLILELYVHILAAAAAS
ncbi:hypothetical protein [Syntrophomonas palmitatica]|uniref:hypothetical protein n=1 Tax=Syntrophomonas palmitatica TaxID=402877 RepID=UPI0006D0E3D6|nr:hypothetical protein [Syntrophomonas palmitatica]